jgi:HD-like signal output (HDOD) protein
VTLIVGRGHTSMPQALTGIPPFPAVAIRALKFLSNESGQLRALSELIATDTALSGEILRVVNSPLVGLRNEISSILQAIVLLGLEHVKGVVLTIATKSYLGNSLEIPALRACWRHSLACAVIAKELAPLSLVEPDVAYTAGLLHDIGRLGLVATYPRKYADFLTSVEKEPGNALQRERGLFGIDHCQAGGQLVTYWKLPRVFIAVTSRHHEAAVDGEPTLLSIVRSSCRMADALGFSVSRPLQIMNYEEVLSKLPARERDQLPREPTKLERSIAIQVNSIE